MIQVFAGKDASRALGRSSLKPEDALADYSVLDASELVVLEDWVKYFTKVSAQYPAHIPPELYSGADVY